MQRASLRIRRNQALIAFFFLTLASPSLANAEEEGPEGCTTTPNGTTFCRAHLGPGHPIPEVTHSKKGFAPYIPPKVCPPGEKHLAVGAKAATRSAKMKTPPHRIAHSSRSKVRPEIAEVESAKVENAEAAKPQTSKFKYDSAFNVNSGKTQQDDDEAFFKAFEEGPGIIPPVPGSVVAKTCTPSADGKPAPALCQAACNQTWVSGFHLGAGLPSTAAKAWPYSVTQACESFDPGKDSIGLSKWRCCREGFWEGRKRFLKAFREAKSQNKVSNCSADYDTGIVTAQALCDSHCAPFPSLGVAYPACWGAGFDDGLLRCLKDPTHDAAITRHGNPRVIGVTKDTLFIGLQSTLGYDRFESLRSTIKPVQEMIRIDEVYHPAGEASH